MLAVRNALIEKFNAVVVSVFPGPYCTVTQLSVRGIPIVLMDDSNYEIYYYTDLTNEQVADQLATELECYLNGSEVRGVTI